MLCVCYAGAVIHVLCGDEAGEAGRVARWAMAEGTISLDCPIVYANRRQCERRIDNYCVGVRKFTCLIGKLSARSVVGMPSSHTEVVGSSRAS